MKVELSPTAVLALVGVAVVGVVAWKLSGKVGEVAAGAVNAAKDAANAVNPLNPDNVFATGANAAASAIAGQTDTLGGAVRSATSNDDERIAAMLRGDPIPPARSIFNPSTWFN